jgi:putative ABC transport system ATP-binding protein
MSLPLTISGLSVRTARGRTLLDLPALEMPAGTLLGVRGPSGAGKSTLLHALGGLIEAKGVVRWGDYGLTVMSAEERTRFRADHVGMIFQDFLLFDEMSPLGNAGLKALFAPRRDRPGIHARAQAHLSALGVPEGERAVTTFSGGERQRVAIARALASDPDVILADEPTAALDREAADRLIADLTRLARDGGKTMVAVSHDPHLLAAMDRVIAIEDGKLVEAVA